MAMLSLASVVLFAFPQPPRLSLIHQPLQQPVFMGRDVQGRILGVQASCASHTNETPPVKDRLECHDRDCTASAVTRIRTWVVSAQREVLTTIRSRLYFQHGMPFAYLGCNAGGRSKRAIIALRCDLCVRLGQGHGHSPKRRAQRPWSGRPAGR